MGIKLAAGCYFGTRVQSREVAGFLLTESIFAAHGSVPKHAHERSYFNLVISGSYAETYGSRDRECQPSTVVFHPAGELHAERMSREGACVFSIEPAAHWLSRAPEYQAVMEKPADCQGGPLARLAFCLYREFRRPDAFTALVVEGLVLEFLAMRGRFDSRLALSRPPLWLARTREILDARFAAPPSLQELALEVGVHPIHLARTFRNRIGNSVGEYVRQRRVEYACRQLAESNTPLIDIAIAAGFFDQSHFARTFRRLMGLTPGAFRHINHSR